MTEIIYWSVGIVIWVVMAILLWRESGNTNYPGMY